MPPRYPPAEQRFLANVQVNGPDECWPWIGGLSNGYGTFLVNGTKKGSHVFAMERVLGSPVPAGKYVCHKCDNRTCCNPAHLYVGTAKDNGADMSRRRRGARANTCLQGHPWTEANTRILNSGSRLCIICNNEYRRLWRLRKKANPNA